MVRGDRNTENNGSDLGYKGKLKEHKLIEIIVGKEFFKQWIMQERLKSRQIS